MKLIGQIKTRDPIHGAEERLVRVANIIRDEAHSDLEKAVVSLAKVFKEELETRINDLVSQFESHMSSMQKSYDQRLAEITELIKNLPTPVVQVSVPKQETPVVNNVVNVPKVGKKIKKITYDSFGRPENIEETEDEG